MHKKAKNVLLGFRFLKGMLQVRRPTYFDRFKKHVEDLQKHLDEEDYVQAAEKIWGALSSFVNAFSRIEAVKVEEKKQMFRTLFRMLSTEKRHLNKVLKENFRDITDFTSKAAGLHLYFYGGKLYPEKYLREIIAGFAVVLKEIRGALDFK